MDVRMTRRESHITFQSKVTPLLWLVKTWLTTSNHNALFQNRWDTYSTLIFLYDIGTWSLLGGQKWKIMFAIWAIRLAPGKVFIIFDLKKNIFISFQPTLPNEKAASVNFYLLNKIISNKTLFWQKLFFWFAVPPFREEASSYYFAKHIFSFSLYLFIFLTLVLQ